MGKQIELYTKYMRVRWVFILGGFDTEEIETSIKEALVTKDEMYILIANSIFDSLWTKKLSVIYTEFNTSPEAFDQMVEAGQAVPKELFKQRNILWDTYKKIEKLYELKAKQNENESNRSPINPKTTDIQPEQG